MKTTKIIAYECSSCEQLYECEEEALTCCSTAVDVTAWRCEGCNELYYDEEDAKNCCKDIEPEYEGQEGKEK